MCPVRPDACRACGAVLSRLFVDFGSAPLANGLRRPDQRDLPEPRFPLRSFVCDQCKLVQLQDVIAPSDLFGAQYRYFSSYSSALLHQAEAYVGMMMARFGLEPGARVIEIGSNDGYLLQYFQSRGLDSLGIEPSANVAAVARERGLPTLVRFFGRALALELQRDGLRADLILGNNVIAHVPDINDFIGAVPLLLKPQGIVTFEFPHLLQMLTHGYWDLIYHEHYSYFSLLSLEAILLRHGLVLFDVEELPAQGGSLRIFAGHAGAVPAASARLLGFRARERAFGLDGLAAYDGFAARVRRSKRQVLHHLGAIRAAGGAIAGYGAPAKGVSLLNYCGIGADLVGYTVDRSPHKQGMLLPGSGIPVYAPQRLFETKPDFVLLLPWNLKEEIMAELDGIRAWGGRFILPMPEPLTC